MLSVNDYKYKSWQQKFPDSHVILEPDINTSWLDLFSKLVSDKRYGLIERKLSSLIREGKKIYPYPDLVFSAFKFTPFDGLKVVIIGQDPYPHSEKGIPQAMGLSFSVPFGIGIPSSLENIYANMMEFGHLSFMPKHGNLQFLAYQGCLFLNTSLTVTDGEKNSHASLWKWFTDEIIKSISDKANKIIFVLWGGPALEKMQLIDVGKHEVIISSHPSGLSFHKPLRQYPPFKDRDHFGEINKLLKQDAKQEIIYGL
jgi:uracil-DNA glycosylase